MPSLVETVVWAMAASLKPNKCPISSSVLAKGMAFSNKSTALDKLPEIMQQINQP